MATTRPQQGPESGTALIMLVLVFLPVMMVYGGFAFAMQGRDARLTEDIGRERCFWAAEAGIDDAVHRAGAGLLPSGVAYELDLGAGSSCAVTAVYLGMNGIDDDGDLEIDEADEDLIEVHSIGRYRIYERELATWLGRVPFLPRLNAAAIVSSTSTDIRLGGTPELNGNDHRLDGTPGDPTQNRYGISIMEPGTVADLQSRLTLAEGNKVLGIGGTPSLGTTTAFDVVALAAQIRNLANLVLTNSSYSGLDFGNAEEGRGYVAYREGNLRLTGNSRGAGILVVTGRLEIAGDCRFDGIIIALGGLEAGVGTVSLYGGLVLGPDAERLRSYGTFELLYSEQAARFADTMVGRYTTFNGWQEVAH